MWVIESFTGGVRRSRGRFTSFDCGGQSRQRQLCVDQAADGVSTTQRPPGIQDDGNQSSYLPYRFDRGSSYRSTTGSRTIST
jgi:hypothetical protein